MCAQIRVRVGLDCLKRSRSCLCSKPPDLREMGDIALIPSQSKVNVNTVNITYGIVVIQHVGCSFRCTFSL